MIGHYILELYMGLFSVVYVALILICLCFMSLYLSPRRVTLSTALFFFLRPFLPPFPSLLTLPIPHIQTVIRPVFCSLFSSSSVSGLSCKQLSYLAFLNSLHSQASTKVLIHTHTRTHTLISHQCFRGRAKYQPAIPPYPALTYLHPAAPAPLKPQQQHQ